MPDRMVVDSSVGAKWFLGDEEDVNLAHDLLDACLTGDLELHAPTAFSYEVCSALAVACRRRPARLDASRAARCIGKLFSLPVAITHLTAEQALEATKLSVRFSKSFFDMAYLRLAEELGCKLCTADARFISSTDPDFPTHRILPLCDLPSALPQPPRP